MPDASPAPRARTASPAPEVLAWAAAVLGHPRLTVLRGLRDGGSPWLLRAGERPESRESANSRERRVVLRVVPPGTPAARAGWAAEVAGLRLAAEAGAPVPDLLGHDDGTLAGCLVVLTSEVPGTSAIPRELRSARLRALGAAAARLHALPREPTADLPLRDRPIAAEDFAAIRASHAPHPLQEQAEARVARTEPASTETVFVHGDLWQGNVLWSGDTLSAIIDWDCAGAGPPGVDLGSLRLDAALCYGPPAAGLISDGWSAVTGRPAPDQAYWDAVAGLATPPDMGWFPAAIAGQGRPDLTRDLLVRRRDEFLAAALAELPPSPPCHDSG